MKTENKNSGLIFDIQSFCVHDGPGCRTTVFLSGCPLRCKWCANPESWDTSETGKLKDKKTRLYSVSDLMQILERDSDNWGMDGGVTFSGGEPLLQPVFLSAVIDKCHEKGIHIAIETSACVPQEIFLEIISKTDFAFVDIKHMNTEKHKAETGKGNETTLSNIRALKNNNWHGRLILRQPVIANYNDDFENAYQNIKFMKEIGQYEINLLPFHRFGATKWEKLGMQYSYLKKGDVSEERLSALQECYLDNEIACYIGEKTSF